MEFPPAFLPVFTNADAHVSLHKLDGGAVLRAVVPALHSVQMHRMDGQDPIERCFYWSTVSTVNFLEGPFFGITTYHSEGK